MTRRRRLVAQEQPGTVWRFRKIAADEEAGLTKEAQIKKILKRAQRGLAEGKWYEISLSEGYVNGEFRKDVQFEAHSQTPDQPTAQLSIIYDYFRFDFSTDDHNMGVSLEKFPTTVESDAKYVVMIHEHDDLIRFGDVVDHSGAPEQEDSSLTTPKPDVDTEKEFYD